MPTIWRVVAAHDRVVNDDHALAGDDSAGVELHPQAVLAQLLAGLMKVRHVAVLISPSS
jgi:hypothetical protein